jgi:16S rRNA (cytosine967-C5)-methyltransferase
MPEASTRSNKLHLPLLKAVEQGLEAVLQDRVPIDKVQAAVSRNRKFGSRDRRFIIGHIYDIVRFRRLFSAIYQKATPVQLHRYSAYVIMNMMRLGHQVANLENIMRADAALASAWSDLLAARQEHFTRDVLLSYPDWMWKLGETDYGDDWPAVAASMNETAGVCLRANTLQISARELAGRLTGEGIDCHCIEGTDAIALKGRARLSDHLLYRNGAFEFQDLASQHVAPMAQVAEGMTVVDACAGAGGKSLHLAALMNNTGRLVVSDKISRRMEQLHYRKNRAGVRNIEVIDYNELGTLAGMADRVILDAPCTATGTIRRKPELKWYVREEDLVKLTAVQRSLLERWSALLKPSGKLVYATCSVFKSEGEVMIRNFLEAHKGFTLEKERRFLPAVDGTDAFYIAVLSKTG